MRRRLATLAALGLMGAALAGCGAPEEGLLPRQTAGELIANLETVEQLARERRCLDAAAASQALIARMGELGNEVDEELRRALVNGTERLVTLARDPEACTGGLIPPQELAPEEPAGEEDNGEGPPASNGPGKGKGKDEDKSGDDEQPLIDESGGMGIEDQPPPVTDQDGGTDGEQQLPSTPPAGSGGTTPEGGQQ